MNADVAGEPWPQIVFAADPANAEALEEALFACGAVSVIYQDQQDQPVLEPKPDQIILWDQIRLIGLFAQNSHLASVLAQLKALLGDSLPSYTVTRLADQQWERVWMDDFKPRLFGSRLWVCPTHCEPPDASAVNLWLDPGLAFGTGTHPTTAQCLVWLDQHDLSGQQMIDYGCGSGILAVAALKLGAAGVIASDIDPQALLATRENARLNGVEDRIEIRDPDSMDRDADLVLANILFQPLLELAPELARLTRSGGDLVMSGLLVSQVDAIKLRYNQHFTFQSSGQQDDWAILHARRREHAN